MSVTAETTEVHESDAFSVLGEALESAAETFGDLTASARDGARKAAHNVSHVVSTGVYKGSYGASYGVVFSAVFLTELLPGGNALRRGLEDGASAALDAAANRRTARAAETAGEELHGGAGTSGRTRQRRSLPAPELAEAPVSTGRRRVRVPE